MSETVFQGTSAIALDAKGRITVPVRQRELLMQACEGRITLTRHLDGFLWFMPRPVWETTRAKLMAMQVRSDGWRRILIGSAVDLEVDSAARVLIPPELREAAGLTKEVLLVGNGRILELWDAERYKAYAAALQAQPMPEEIQSLVLQ